MRRSALLSAFGALGQRTERRMLSLIMPVSRACSSVTDSDSLGKFGTDFSGPRVRVRPHWWVVAATKLSVIKTVDRLSRGDLVRRGGACWCLAPLHRSAAGWRLKASARPFFSTNLGREQ
jgi:hypothetical protein